MHPDAGTTGVTSGSRRVVFLGLILSSVLMGAQDTGIVCLQQFKTSNNCYRLYKSATPQRGLVVLLPYYGSDANAFSSSMLPTLLAKKNIATITVSAAGYLSDDEVATLKGLIALVAHELDIPAGTLAIGGVSS